VPTVSLQPPEEMDPQDLKSITVFLYFILEDTDFTSFFVLNRVKRRLLQHYLYQP
jgi:hypothetical protein